MLISRGPDVDTYADEPVELASLRLPRGLPDPALLLGPPGRSPGHRLFAGRRVGRGRHHRGSLHEAPPGEAALVSHGGWPALLRRRRRAVGHLRRCPAQHAVPFGRRRAVWQAIRSSRPDWLSWSATGTPNGIEPAS